MRGGWKNGGRYALREWQEDRGWGVFWTTSELSVSAPTSGRTAAQDEGEWRKTEEQGAERFMAKRERERLNNNYGSSKKAGHCCDKRSLDLRKSRERGRVLQISVSNGRPCVVFWYNYCILTNSEHA